MRYDDFFDKNIFFKKNIEKSPASEIAAKIFYKNYNLKEDVLEKIVNYKKATNLSSILNHRTSFQGGTQTAQTPIRLRWSPESDAGVVYEWDRGVIAIGPNGEIVKEVLDGTLNHHADATVRVASELGVTIESTNLPFIAGCEASNRDLVIFQSEGDGALFYLPKSVTPEQTLAIYSIARPRTNFNFSAAYQGIPIDDISYETLMFLVKGLTRSLDKGLAMAL